ncbi:EmrB/QacA subfamily drug resistance transporter [Actinocorallia herbida]|uniref:EmrB/QacA subfamily drug resistance transporter n=1 Tax=Actinocorallia herbida TaxID=58109 RepID=A0A3N1D1W2_9ACTN|nr:MFS transporter [Actinocorallia herbida]ROO87519.1 EmrB/QacA subfamily drug resistance transporter [Actinocorallia herbida]
MSRDPSPASREAAEPYRWRWLILVVMIVAEIMDLLDASIVNVAGPDLEKSLGAGSVGLQWVIGGYALTLGAGLVLGGRLGDRYGRRPIFLVGLAAFTAASLLCAIAPSIGALIAFRLLQGAAGAMLLPQGLGLLRENFSGPELTKVFAIFGPVLGLGGIIGPVLGGFLIEGDFFGLGWRSVFLINLPIGIAALITAAKFVPKKPGDRTVRVDLTGAALVVTSCALLVLPLNQGQEDGWPLWTWLCVTASVIGFGVFAYQQRRTAAAGRQALIAPALLRKPAFTVGLGGIALFFGGLIGTQLVLTLFLQIGRHFTAGEAGLGNLPLAIGTAIGGALSGAFLADKIGRKVLQIGSLVQLAGAAVLWFELDGLTTASFSIWDIAPGIAIAGIGAGMVIAALFSFILAAVDDDEIGSASGILSAVQAIGGSIGVAIFGSVFFAQARTGDFTTGFHHALLVQACLLITFLAITFLLPEKGRPEDEQHGITHQPSTDTDTDTDTAQHATV